MDQNFDLDAFIRRIGERLVDQFEDARAGTNAIDRGFRS